MFFSDVGHKGSAVSVPFGAFGTFMIRSAVARVDMVIEGSSFFIPLSACAATPEIDIFFRQKNFGHLMHVRMSGRSTKTSWLHLDLAQTHNRTRVYVDLTPAVCRVCRAVRRRKMMSPSVGVLASVTPI